MTKSMPSVPPDQRGGQDPDEKLDLRDKHRKDPENSDEAGQTGNIRQNLSNRRKG